MLYCLKNHQGETFKYAAFYCSLKNNLFDIFKEELSKGQINIIETAKSWEEMKRQSDM